MFIEMQKYIQYTFVGSDSFCYFFSCTIFLQENGYQECLNSPKTADQTAESPEEDPVFMV